MQLIKVSWINWWFCKKEQYDCVPGRPIEQNLAHYFFVWKLVDINNYQTAIFMYKVKYGVLPQSALKYTAVNDTNRIHFTRTLNNFTIFSFLTGICSKSTAVHGPRLWNFDTEFNRFWFVWAESKILLCQLFTCTDIWTYTLFSFLVFRPQPPSVVVKYLHHRDVVPYCYLHYCLAGLLNWLVYLEVFF